MKMKLFTLLCYAVICLFLPASVFALPLEPTPAPPGARVYFISPADGDKVQSPFTLRFGLENMGIAPEGIDVEGTGHHHLLVDGRAQLNPNEPMEGEVMHMDKGQTQVDLFLTPGTHTLQIIFGDYLHRPFNPPIVSKIITVRVSSE
jgi:Domain of unknown function (DUF4399)